jgi:YHS domain-containing protein
MTPVRLLVLGILFYLAYRLLRNMLRARSIEEYEQRQREQKARESKVQDVLVEDPVCHKLIPKHQAVRLRQDGTTIYFCSEACCDKYTATSGEKD